FFEAIGTSHKISLAVHFHNDTNATAVHIRVHQAFARFALTLFLCLRQAFLAHFGERLIKITFSRLKRLLGISNPYASQLTKSFYFCNIYFHYFSPPSLSVVLVFAWPACTACFT